MARDVCDCARRFGPATPVPEVFLRLGMSPYVLCQRATGFYDVVNQQGHQANLLSMCVHEAQRMVLWLNRLVAHEDA